MSLLRTTLVGDEAQLETWMKRTLRRRWMGRRARNKLVMERWIPPGTRTSKKLLKTKVTKVMNLILSGEWAIRME